MEHPHFQRKTNSIYGRRYMIPNTCKVKGKIRHGFGKQDYMSGDRYEGQWEEDLKHGVGVYTWKNGTTYSGEWKHGMRHGTGKYTFADGRSFIGKWVKDRVYEKTWESTEDYNHEKICSLDTTTSASSTNFATSVARPEMYMRNNTPTRTSFRFPPYMDDVMKMMDDATKMKILTGTIYNIQKKK